MARLAIFVHLLAPILGLWLLASWWTSLDHHAAFRSDCRECASVERTLHVGYLLGPLLLAYVVLLVHAIRQTRPLYALPDADAPLPHYLRRRDVATGSVLALTLLLTCGMVTRHVPRNPFGSRQSMGMRLEPAMGLRVDGRWELITAWDEDVERRINELGARAEREARLGLGVRRWSWGPLTELLIFEKHYVLIDGVGFTMPVEDVVVLRSAYLSHLEHASYGGYRELVGPLKHGAIVRTRVIGTGFVQMAVVAACTWIACTALACGIRRALFLSDCVVAQEMRARRARHRRNCARCRYDLRGLNATVCPECGYRIPTAPPAPAYTEGRR